MEKKYTIAVAGTGYVGLSIATLLSQNHKVYAVDIIPEKVEMINNRISPINDKYIEKHLAEKELDLTATLDSEAAYRAADFVVIATPTNYDSKTQFFKSIREKTGCKNIIFSPEFLRESKALYDNLFPSRIIVGTDLTDERLVNAAHTFAELLQEGAIKKY